MISGIGLFFNCSYDEIKIAVKQAIAPIRDNALYLTFSRRPIKLTMPKVIRKIRLAAFT